MKPSTLALIVVVLGLVTTVALGQATHLQSIGNPTPKGEDSFGVPLGVLNGTFPIVGAPGDDASGGASGIAYLFNPMTGALVTTFDNPTPASFDQFGGAVAGVGANNVVIGAAHDDTYKTNAGAAYLFDTTGPNATLLATMLTHRPAKNARQNDSFGAAVASNGNIIAVGAINDLNSDTGAVFLYDSAGTKISGGIIGNPESAAGDHFGSSLAMTQTHLLVGARDDDGLAGTGLFDEGSAYLFDTSGTLLQTFRNPAAAAGDYFGDAVALHETYPGGGSIAAGSYSFVSAPAHGGQAGFVYMFDNATGAHVQTFDGCGGCFMGQTTIAVVTPNTLLAGILGDDSVETNSGAARLFEISSGKILLSTIKQPVPGNFDFFGVSVAALDPATPGGMARVVVSSTDADDYGFEAGAIYVFEIPEPSALGLLAVGGLALLRRRRAA